MNNSNEKNTTVTNEGPSEASFGGARYKRNYDRYKENGTPGESGKASSRKAKIVTVIAVTAFAAVLVGLTFFVVGMMDKSKETGAAATGETESETPLSNIDVKDVTVKLEVTGAEGARNGYGLILTADGYIMADSALTADATAVNAVLDNGKTVTAYAAGIDEENGVTFLKADADDLTAAEIVDLSKLKDGETLYLVDVENGNSFQFIISDEVDTDDGRYSLVDRSKFFGSAAMDLSGRLAVNASGEVVAFPVEKDDGSWRLVFMTEVLPSIKDVINSGNAILGSDEEAAVIDRLGISVKPVTADISEAFNIPSGCFVASVPPTGSKLRKGDIIVSVDGSPADSAESLISALSSGGGKLRVYRLNGYIEINY